MPKRKYKHDKATDPTFAQANALAAEFWKRAYLSIANNGTIDPSDSIHSCSAGCGKPMCKARRRIEALEKAGDVLWQFAKTADTYAYNGRRKALKRWLTLRQKK